MLELRRVIEPYVAFSDKAILEGAAPWGRSLEVQTLATIPVKTQLAPTQEPTEVAAPTKISTKEGDPTEVPTEVAAPTEVSTEEADPIEVPTEVLTPTEVSAKEPATPLATISGPVEESNVPPWAV